TCIVRGVATGECGEFARLGELLASVGAGGIEQPVLCDIATHVGGDKRFHDEIHQEVDDVRRRDVRPGCHGDGRFDQERTGKYRESTKDHSLAFGKQLV